MDLSLRNIPEEDYDVDLTLESTNTSFLYGEVEPIDILNIKKLDLDNLIVLSSSELLIPTLHVKLKKKKLLRFFPNDFCQYIEWIYNENKANNLILIESITQSIEK